MDEPRVKAELAVFTWVSRAGPRLRRRPAAYLYHDPTGGARPLLRMTARKGTP